MKTYARKALVLAAVLLIALVFSACNIEFMDSRKTVPPPSQDAASGDDLPNANGEEL